MNLFVFLSNRKASGGADDHVSNMSAVLGPAVEINIIEDWTEKPGLQ